MSSPSPDWGGDPTDPAERHRRLLGTIGRGWRAAILVASDLPLLIGVTFATLAMLDWLSGNLVSQVIRPPSHPSGGSGLVRTVVVAALHALLLAPLLVAIYRRLSGPDATPSPPAPVLLLRFAAWSFLVGMILPVGLLPRFFKRSPALSIVGGSAQIVGLFVQVRLLLLLPAVALGARRGVLRDSWRRTRDRFWWLLVGSTIANAPCWLPSAALVGLRFWSHVSPTGSATLDVAAEALGVLSVVLTAAFAAQVFTDLPRPPEPVADHAS